MNCFWRNIHIVIIVYGLLAFAGAAIAFYKFLTGEFSTDTAIAAMVGLVATLTLLITIIGLYLTVRSLEISNNSLQLASLDVLIRVRPFVSVAEIKPMISAEDVQDPPVYGFDVIVQNTGIVPASTLDLRTSLRNRDANKILSEISSSIPLLSPNGQHTFKLTGMPQGIRTNLYNGTIHFEILLKYAALGQNYETMQTYRLERSPQPVVPGTSPILLRPIAPSYYS